MAQDESKEIDRIMKEIEDLEKNLDTPVNMPSTEDSPFAEEDTTPVSEALSSPAKPQDGAAESVSRISDLAEVPSEEQDSLGARVVSIRKGMGDSMAETDAVPVQDTPLFKGAAAPNGGMSLSVGGCSDVRLEFSRAGVTVLLSCTDEGVSITTGDGAEFRIPLKRVA